MIWLFMGPKPGSPKKSKAGRVGEIKELRPQLQLHALMDAKVLKQREIKPANTITLSYLPPDFQRNIFGDIRQVQRQALGCRGPLLLADDFPC
jgi:hypothetical protein